MSVIALIDGVFRGAFARAHTLITPYARYAVM